MTHEVYMMYSAMQRLSRRSLHEGRAILVVDLAARQSRFEYAAQYQHVQQAHRTSRKEWRRGRESNPRMAVLQTAALPFRHRVIVAVTGAT